MCCLTAYLPSYHSADGAGGEVMQDMPVLIPTRIHIVKRNVCLSAQDAPALTEQVPPHSPWPVSITRVQWRGLVGLALSLPCHKRIA